MTSLQVKPLAPLTPEVGIRANTRAEGLGRVDYLGLRPGLPKVWPGASGAWWGLTEDDGPCVVTELSLGRGLRGEQHIEEPEGGGRGE